MTAEPATGTYGLRGALVRGLRAGLVVAPVYTVLALLLPEDVQVWMWGGAVFLGPLLVVVGLAFYALGRGFMRYDQRLQGLDRPAQPYPSILRTERGFLWAGLALVVSALLLSAVLLARGETLF